MRNGIVLFLSVALISGCTTAQKISRPGGQVEYQIACGAATGWDICYNRAEEVCPSGYTTVKEDQGFNRKELRINCVQQ
jgi:hypothetical protein